MRFATPLPELSGAAPSTGSSREQFLRFCIVGASGYVVNICVFALALALSVQHLVAAGVGFAVAVASNFWWNRRWTFATGDPALARQAARFFTVSAVACLFAVTVLELLMGPAGFPALVAQPASVIAATPLGFVGNKAWSFGCRAPATAEAVVRHSKPLHNWG